MSPGEGSPGDPPAAAATDVAACLRCGYALRGLAPDGMCPECGTPIERSLRGNFLVYSDPAYVRWLHAGSVLIEAALAARVLLIGALLAAQVAAGATGWSSAPLEGAWKLGNLGASAAALAGWWALSAPDPAFLGAGAGSRARVVVRWVVCITAGMSILDLIVQVAPLSAGLSVSTQARVLVWLAVLVGGFLAEMLYIQWLTRRLPDRRLHRFAGTMLWLAPVLCTIGVLVCYIGPIAAYVLYWVLIDRLRSRLGAVLRLQAR